MDSRRPWQQLSLPDTVTGLPSMLSAEDKQYLTWLATEKLEGWGAIVQLGAWLGGDTAALAEGLRRRSSKDIIHAFDPFVWEDWMSALAPSDLKPGDDFLSLFLDGTKEYSPSIHVEKTDLQRCSWVGDDIEVLYVNQVSGWDSANAFLRAFGPRLVPGRSRVVLRDFRYHYNYCLPLIFDSRPDVWAQVEAENIEDGTLITFMPLRPLFGPAGIDTNYLEESFPLASAERLLRSRMAREKGRNQQLLLRGLYRRFLIDGPIEEVRKLRIEVLAGGIDEPELKALENVESSLHSRGWKAIDERDYETARAAAERCIWIRGDRSVQTLILLAYSLLHLEDRSHLDGIIDDLGMMEPGLPSVLLLRGETDLIDGRCGQAERKAMDILKSGTADEPIIEQALSLLVRAWDRQHISDSRLAILSEFTDIYFESPSFLAHLAREKLMAGQHREAITTVERALQLAPGHHIAAAVSRRIGALNLGI